jgi:O-antigen ligase
MNKIKFFKEIAGVGDLLVWLGIIGAIIIVPLYFSAFFPVYNQFILSETILFRIFVLISLAGMILRWPLQPVPKAWHFFWLAPTVLLGALAVTIPFSSNWVNSLFGSYTWQEGWLSYLYFYLWAALLVYNLPTLSFFGRDRSGQARADFNLEMVLKLLLAVSVPVALYGILQVLGIDFVVWAQNPVLTHRAMSFFGQPNYLADWLLFIMPVTAYFLFKKSGFISRLVYSLILLIQLTAFLLTGSRSALAALGLAIFGGLIYLVSKYRSAGKKFYRNVLLVFFGLLIMAAAGLMALNPARLTELSHFNSGSLEIRQVFWKDGLAAIIKKPLFGYGLDAGGEAYIGYYRPDWALTSPVNSSTDRAHNLILDWLLAVGLFGTIFFIWFFISVGLNLKAALKVSPRIGLPFFISIALGAYLLVLMFNFSVVMTNINFWLVVAVASLLRAGVAPEVQSSELRTVRLKLYLPIAISLLIIIFSAGIFETQRLMADYYFAQFNNKLNAGDYGTAFVLENYIVTTAVDPAMAAYYRQTIIMRINDIWPGLNTKVLSAWATNIVKVNLVKLPETGFSNLLARATGMSLLGQSQPANELFSRLAVISPFWPVLYSTWGEALTAVHSYPAAIDKYRLAQQCLPSDGTYISDSNQRDALYQYRSWLSRLIKAASNH